VQAVPRQTIVVRAAQCACVVQDPGQFLRAEIKQGQEVSDIHAEIHLYGLSISSGVAVSVPGAVAVIRGVELDDANNLIREVVRFIICHCQWRQ